MSSLPIVPDYKLSGGPVSAEHAAEYYELRERLKNQPDVYEVLALERQADGSWLYLIRTPLQWVFPSYVIGSTDAKNKDAAPIFECGAEWSAKDHWTELTRPDRPA